MDDLTRKQHPVRIVVPHTPASAPSAAPAVNGAGGPAATSHNGHTGGHPGAAIETPTRPRPAVPPYPDPAPTGPPEGAPPAAPAPDAAAGGASDAPTARPGRTRGIGRRLRNLVLAVLAVVALGTGTVVGYRWYEDSITYVSTDNAQIAGPLIQVGGLEAGRVAVVRYDVGDRVNQNDVVAQLTIPTPVSVLPNGTPNQQFTGTTDTIVDVCSPVSGVVVARNGNPGDTVQAGQSLLTVADPNQLWVTANVEETRVPRLRPGQPVQIHVDNLNADLTGHVAAIAQASAQSFSAIPQQNLSGNYTKVTQLQPVKIVLDQIDPRLAVGTSVEVKIRVAG
jgi:multidrug efflux pump subunit AcrA (membrane-fusion protein)